MAKILAISTLTPYINACVNRDQTGEAKTCSINNEIRTRISSQCSKNAVRSSEEFEDVVNAYGSKHYRTREFFNLIEEELKAENLANANSIPKYTNQAIEKLVGSKVKSKGKKAEESDADETEVTNDPLNQLSFISRAEIEAIKDAIRIAVETKNDSEIKNLDLKKLDYKLSFDIALTGKFNTVKFLPSSVDGSWGVAHSFSIHRSVSYSDYYTATDDLAKKDSGAAYLDSSNLGSNIFYGFSYIDLDQLCENLFKQDLGATCQDPEKKAFLTGQLSKSLEIMFQVLPQGKHSSTAPKTKPSFGLLELSSSPQSADQAFWTTVKNDNSIWENTYNRLIDFIRDNDAIYNTKQGLSRGYFGLYMNQDQKQAFEQDLGCSKVSMSSLKTWLESAIDKINTEI